MSLWNSRLPFENNCYYHIYNRWYNKQFIFKNTKDFERFYKLLIKYTLEYSLNFKLVSYCFLPNHFHMIIHNYNAGSKISDFMKKLQWNYSIWNRIKYPIEIKQPFFEWRFKAKLIKDEEYLAKCMAYVNYNAVKHGVVKDIRDYPYTSYHQLVNKSRIESYKDLILDELEL